MAMAEGVKAFPRLLADSWERFDSSKTGIRTPQDAVFFLSSASDSLMTALSGLAGHDGQRCRDCEAHLLFALVRMGTLARQIAEGLDLVPADRPWPIRLPTSDIEAGAN
jgi:hypothetical protein